jgi:AraC-like DNA-binding protein/mannose-6-phosphate isomerase-like protein (cupin superfamily)
MPIKRQTNTNSLDIDQLPQPIVSFGQDLAKGEILPYHHHTKTQLVYASEGMMTVKTKFAAYLIPPQRAVWMPGGVEHQIESRSHVKMRTLYIESRLAEELITEVCVLQVSPLLRELIVEAVAGGIDYNPEGPLSRLMMVILDQIRKQPLAPSLALPMPHDPRLKSIAQRIIDDPADTRELADWSRQVGASVRTLVRLFPAQTGMTFRQWRQQSRLLRALELLAAGDSVTRIALELGYENSSSFIAMFKRSLGTTPTRYLKEN